MEIENKDIAIGALIIGIVALAGWVGFLYVNPLTKTKTEEDEETTLIYVYPTSEKSGIPTDWSTAPNASSFIIYNETGSPKTVTFKDILNGVALWNDEQTDPTIERLSHKYEFMDVYTVVDPISGKYFTGVDPADVFESKGIFYAYELTARSNKELYGEVDVNIGLLSYLNDESEPTIIAIACEGKWLTDSSVGSYCGNFTLIGSACSTVYDLKEIEVTEEWEVEIYVDTVLQPFRVNRTTIENPNKTGGWTYSYHKQVEKYCPVNSTFQVPRAGDTVYQINTGEMTYNRTFWGLNISYIVNQTVPGGSFKSLYAYTVDAYAGYQYNHTDVHNGLTRPGATYLPKQGRKTGNNGYTWVNSSNPTPLPQIDLIMTLVNMEQKHSEYGLWGPDPTWEKGYLQGYHKGPFQLIIPGKTKNSYAGWVDYIVISTT